MLSIVSFIHAPDLVPHLIFRYAVAFDHTLNTEVCSAAYNHTASLAGNMQYSFLLCPEALLKCCSFPSPG